MYLEKDPGEKVAACIRHCFWPTEKVYHKSFGFFPIQKFKMVKSGVPRNIFWQKGSITEDFCAKGIGLTTKYF